MPRKKKTYKVTGAAGVLDHQPGETFEATLEEDQEKLLVSIGALTVTQSEKKD